MPGGLPAVELHCYKCEHRWSTRAKAGLSIRCPKCRKVRRVPAARPRSAAQARAIAAGPGDDDGLAAAWAAETPLGPGSGTHPGNVSAKARARIAEQLAAIDKSAARKSAQLADPEAERIAAEQLAADRAELAADIADLAEILDNAARFPRRWPWREARRAGIRYGAVAGDYARKAAHAETLDQLDRARRDFERFADSIAGWTERIDELGGGLDIPEPRMMPGAVDYEDDDVLEGEVLGDDLDDDDDSDPWAGRVERQLGQLRHKVRQLALTAAESGPPPVPGNRWCQRCRYAQGHLVRSIASVEAPGLETSPVRVCADCLAELWRQHGRALYAEPA